VRDIFETETGDFVSPSNTGTDPALPDTDGDLYRDGSERAGGSDPTDSSSIPAPLAPGVPVLSLTGLLVLTAFALAVGAFVIRPRRSVSS